MGRFQVFLKNLESSIKSKINMEELEKYYDIQTFDSVSESPIWVTGRTTTYTPSSNSTFDWSHIERLREQIERDTRIAMDLPIIDTKDEEKPAKLLKRKKLGNGKL